MNVLYQPLNKKETNWGLIIAAVYLVASTVLEALLLQPVQWVLVLLAFAAVIISARRFWMQSIGNLALTGKQLIWKPLLGALACKVVCFLVHDLFLLLGFPYFVSTDWGPMLWDVRGSLLETAAEGRFWFAAVSVVVLMPIVEEFLFRGVILGNLYPNHSIIAVILSVALFAVFHTLPYIDRINDVLYLCLYAFQFIPMGLALAWLYISTDSIFAPIFMHIIFNYALIF